MLNAQDALKTLKEGNARFASGMRSVANIVTPAVVAASAEGQQPFAIVLACSDSRVPVELIFDQGVGDLFVIRVAGNIVAPSLVGSAEFAAANFGTRLVVVLGHSGCGAIAATIDAVRTSGEIASPNISYLVTRIRPIAASVLENTPGIERGAAISQCVRANVRHGVDHLRHGSALLENLASDGLQVVGAEYDLTTGRVAFLD
ncbi:MAG: hypothetical protein RL701_6297 [Pseudomonadota bacterium]